MEYKKPDIDETKYKSVMEDLAIIDLISGKSTEPIEKPTEPRIDVSKFPKERIIDIKGITPKFCSIGCLQTWQYDSVHFPRIAQLNLEEVGDANQCVMCAKPPDTTITPKKPKPKKIEPQFCSVECEEQWNEERACDFPTPKGWVEAATQIGICPNCRLELRSD